MVAIAGKGWKLAPSLKLLVDEFDHEYPHREHDSDGSIGDAAHASRDSDHNPFDGFVHAVDIDENIAPGDKPVMPFAERLRVSRDPRIQYVIYEGRVFKSYVKDGHEAWSWLPYTGPNAHDHHLHVSIKRTAFARNDLAPWPVADQEDDMYDDADRARDKEIERKIDNLTGVLDVVNVAIRDQEGGIGAQLNKLGDRIAAVDKAIDDLDDSAPGGLSKTDVKAAVREVFADAAKP